MAHGERAAQQAADRKEYGGRDGYGWMSRGWVSKWITKMRRRTRERREIRDQLRELEEKP